MDELYTTVDGDFKSYKVHLKSGECLIFPAHYKNKRGFWWANDLSSWGNGFVLLSDEKGIQHIIPNINIERIEFV